MNKRALTALASLGLLLGAAGAGAVPAISDTDGHPLTWVTIAFPASTKALAARTW
jgi:hypothetical protein